MNPWQPTDAGAPDPLDEPMPPAHILLRLDGRIGRATWWRYGVLLPVVGGLVLQALLDIARVAPTVSAHLVNLVLFWPAIAVSAKRWHDRGQSGWWVLVLLVPVVGWLWALVFNGLLRGDDGPNRYGPATDAPGWPAGQAPPAAQDEPGRVPGGFSTAR